MYQCSGADQRSAGREDADVPDALDQARRKLCAADKAEGLAGHDQTSCPCAEPFRRKPQANGSGEHHGPGHKEHGSQKHRGGREQKREQDGCADVRNKKSRKAAIGSKPFYATHLTVGCVCNISEAELAVS